MPKSGWRRRTVLVLGVLLMGCSTSGPDLPDRSPRSESERTGWSGAPIAADPEQIAAGRRIAERYCSSCHAIDRTSPSLQPGAPPLRDVLVLNDADRIAYRLIDSIRLGHDKMPLFDLDVKSANALVAYIESIGGP